MDGPMLQVARSLLQEADAIPMLNVTEIVEGKNPHTPCLQVDRAVASDAKPWLVDHIGSLSAVPSEGLLLESVVCSTPVIRWSSCFM
jgi:hypothetical protein